MPSHLKSSWKDPILTLKAARGTSEPNYEEGDGKFGVVVGDPVVSNVTAILPDARGYPVQVCL